ncbi:MAG TPA: hypothetical protein VF772_17285 [Terriglobales bacterium]
MIRHRFPLSVFAALLLAGVCALAAPPAQAQAAKSSNPDTAEKMTPQTRMLVIRSLQSERVFARIMFPQGDKGIKIKNGVVSPSDMVIAQQVSEFGAAAKPGDRCVITDVLVKENEILVDINGGPKKHQKWYQHIEVAGMGGGSTPLPGGPSPQSLDAHGSRVTLEFDKYVPEMTGDQVRALLAPVFDFKALTQAEAYEKTLPPKVQEAIKNHQILVGMDKEMVMYAKGRPPKKVRDKDEKGQDYEEWIYGNPPEEVDFVRFKGNEVARLEIMTVDGQKIVRTEKEVELPSKETELAQQQPKTVSPTDKPSNAPTLRRPGEEAEYPSTTSDHRAPPPPSPNGTSCPDPTCANPQTIPPPLPPNGVPQTSPTGDAPHVIPSH